MAGSRVKPDSRGASFAALGDEYDALLEQCGAGVLVVDADGTIETDNGLMRGLAAPSRRTLVGRSLEAVFPVAEVRTLLEAVRTSNVAHRQEIRLPEPGAKTVILAISPVRGRKKVRRFLVVAQDVTELRRLERVRRDFVANVSHELRTPLASIRAMAETLQAGALHDDSVADRFLGRIVTETERLTRIAEDLLVLSDAESRVSARNPFDLSELIGEVTGRFGSQAAKASVGISADVPESLPVTANRDQIEQVLVNLLDNAIKYTPAGGRVAVTAEETEAAAEVRVADTGIGLRKKDLPRIFERFYRVDKARSRQSGGTGLGLSIVKHIVESHGGTVRVTSSYGHGSTFSFMLPAHDPVDDPAHAGPAGDSAGPHSHHDSRRTLG